ncbi:MAG TPA: arginine--tRNA ligase [Candidatus Acidoferrales bacterium]|nr:arginine--tRNA ligase [Candidatus Acidoferrales bacterium]
MRAAIAAHIEKTYGLTINVTLERPPKLAMGEMATPVCFELAKRLKRAPRQIAQEIAAALSPVIPSMGGVARLELAGGGYLNAFLDRGAYLAGVAQGAGREAMAPGIASPKVIVEHTNINPNKAAHIGHLRNAALGDTLVRLLRHAGRRVEVQNYIDNTGVQVADVVVGFLHLENKSAEEVLALAARPRFDYECWDLYARVTHFFEEDKTRLALRAEALKHIEEDAGEAAEIGRVVGEAIVRRHLETMARLGVEYDVLPRESEILHLKFWVLAFEKLKESGAIHLATSGKNAGCWVMRMGAAKGAGGETTEGETGGGAESGVTEDDTAKIIVRSNGTVTYVGKDIAYQLWKFGLLGLDFRYARFAKTSSGGDVWVSTSGPGEPDAPQFGHGDEVYNVIDSRQAYLQNVVVAGLRALGHGEQADRSTHFSYEMVALTPRAAQELGYTLSPEEEKRSYVEMSGRRGLGVKADDLIDRLEDATRAEIIQRNPELDPLRPDTLAHTQIVKHLPYEHERTAHAVAIGALRYFLLKFTRNAVISFDFREALSFDGETGPYCQYAVVRARNIVRKAAEQGAALEGTIPAETMNRWLAAPDGDDLWELALLAGMLGSTVAGAIQVQEPAILAKFAFQLAQAFNLFYHKHHILSEEDAGKKAFLLQLVTAVEKQLVAALGLLGIESPERM